MIIIRFAILYTMLTIIQNSFCLNLIDLPQELYASRIKKPSNISFRASEIDEPSPQKLANASPTASPNASPNASLPASPTAPSTTTSINMSLPVSPTTSPSTSPTPLPPNTTMSNNTIENLRRYWLVNEKPDNGKRYLKSSSYEDEKDMSLKSKISMLVNQTMTDTTFKMQDIESIKDKYRDHKAYRVGFVLSLIKKSRDVLNELFNVAVKHKDEWRSLEQLKIFELIVHTNLDTTNLLRQLVDAHVGNSTVAEGSVKG